MALFALRKPLSSKPLVDIGDPINRGQVGWWLANEGTGGKVANIANPNLYTGALQSGVTWTNQTSGRTLAFDGTATSYVDLGTAALLKNTDPFTLSWIENVGTSPPAFAALACFFPTGSAQRWLLLRDDSNASYQYLSLGLGSAAAVRRFSSAPTLASSVGKVRHWLLYVGDGMAGTGVTQATIQLYVDGQFFTATTGGSFSSQTSNFNYMGWDGADSKWKGNLEMRMWNRGLTGAELNRLISDPFTGTRKSRLFLRSGPAATFNRMLLAM